MAINHPPEPPFPATKALNKEHLRTPQRPDLQINDSALSPLPTDQSVKVLSHVPGDPTIDLEPAEVHAFLTKELSTTALDELYDWLWLVGRKSGRSIDPLHRQRYKARDIVPTEDPKLHLIWYHDKIYIKPIPVCLLNYGFWTTYLASSVDSILDSPAVRRQGSSLGFDRSVAVGFMRSYAYLIRHQLDFILARELHLIPEDVDWLEWSTFIVHFRCIDDDQVAVRYHYGQLRLSRLNWAVRIFRPRTIDTAWFYEIPYWSTSIYLEHAVGPLIFIFASLSLVLSSMQVTLSVPADGLVFGGLDGSGLQTVRKVFWVFSTIVLLLSGAVWALLLIIPFSVILWQLLWGFRHRGKQRGAVGP